MARKPPGFGFVWFDSERDAVRCNFFPCMIPSSCFAKTQISLGNQFWRFHPLCLAQGKLVAEKSSQKPAPWPYFIMCSYAHLFGLRNTRKRSYSHAGGGMLWLTSPGICQLTQRDAVRDLDGGDCRGNRVRVELSNPR